VLQHLGGDHHVEPAVGERQLVGAGVQEPGAGNLAPVGPQPGVRQVEGDDLAPAPVHLAGDHALAAADLQRPLRQSALAPGDLVEDSVQVGHPAFGQPADRRVAGGVLVGVVADHHPDGLGGWGVLGELPGHGAAAA
jgi:hypothetical protein